MPEHANKASIEIYSLSGRLVNTTMLTQKGKGRIVINTDELTQGTYTYVLLMDGKQVASKKLVIAKP